MLMVRQPSRRLSKGWEYTTRMDYDLECQSIVKTFGVFRAVDQVSFQIERGSFFSILGPSGCGKTTLMRMIAGFYEPDSGDIHIKGRSVLSTPPNRRPVNMVFQHLALFPMMTVAENIAYGLRRRRASRSEIETRVADALHRIGLPDSGEKRIDQLSGGQKQRIAIARCMVLDPDVLLLDEPLGALDLKLREHMKVELKQLQHQLGTTFVYITHDQSEALVMSDRVAVMNDGKFEQVGTPQDLYFQPDTAFVAGFVGDSNKWRGRVLNRDATSLKLEADSGETLVGVPGGSAAADRGMAVDIFVRPESISLRRVTSSEPTSTPGDTVNHRAAVVESVLFNGAQSRALVKTRQGEDMAVALPQTGEYADLREGEEVTLAWSIEHCRCYPASSG